jgi:nucleotide-binding universal stress UspA family protein
MFKKILVPLDGSAFSELALDNALKLISGSGKAELIVIHVVEPFKSIERWVSDDIAQKMEKEAVKVAQKYIDRTVEKLSGKGIPAEGVIAKGEPAEVIREYALKTGVDLIVMGTHGRTGFSRLMFGNVATKVIHNLAVPVLLVPPNISVHDK